MMEDRPEERNVGKLKQRASVYTHSEKHQDQGLRENRKRGKKTQKMSRKVGRE